MLSQAIEMAFLAGDTTFTVVLIERFIATPRYKELHEYHTLFRWLKQLPVAALKRSPSLCLSYATALLFAAPTDRLDPRTLTLVEECLREAEAGFQAMADQPALGETFALRALIYWRQDRLQQAANDARQALALLPAHEVLWLGIAETILGREALYNGEFRLARRTFQHTHTLGKKLFTRTDTALPAWTWGKGLLIQTTATLLARTCFQQGELHLAAEYYHQVLSETRESGESPARIQALLGAALIAYEWNDLEQAERLARESSLQARHQASEAGQVGALLLQARVLQARGETDTALKLLVELQARQLQLVPQIEREILLERARLHLALDDLTVVQHWAAERANPPQEKLSRSQYEQEALLMARFHLAQGKAQEAGRSLQQLLDETPESEHSRIGLEIQVLLALAEAANREITEARQRLQTVLSLAQPEGYQRLFLDEGNAMARLLRSVASHLRETSLKTYLQHLLQAFGSAPLDLAASPLLEPLSPQEVRVLRELSTGSSAPQIAQQLVVSVTTVRSQIQSIYRKLQVNNRVAASEAARVLHLL